MCSLTKKILSWGLGFEVGRMMKETLRYLAGIAGPSDYGSKSTAEQVTQNCCSSFPSQLTAIITG